jgi:uncharacterized protein YndB with AHSA1/START domain
MENSTTITIDAIVNAPVAKVWEFWTNPIHIMKWNNAAPEWHTPFAENNLTEGGRFRSTIAAKDGSVSFDFEGTYTAVIPFELIEYRLDDNRMVRISFTADESSTEIIEAFETESQNPVEMQRDGWQAILNNFKAYTENEVI